MPSRAHQAFNEDGAIKDGATRKQVGDFLRGFAGSIKG